MELERLTLSDTYIEYKVLSPTGLNIFKLFLIKNEEIMNWRIDTTNTFHVCLDEWLNKISLHKKYL